MTKPSGSLSIWQASQQNTSLARLISIHAASKQNWHCVEPLIPLHLLSASRPGPVQEGVWTLYADNPGTATKLRHLKPRLLEKLVHENAGVTDIKIKTHQPTGR
jgi:hypothetical protein